MPYTNAFLESEKLKEMWKKKKKTNKKQEKQNLRFLSYIWKKERFLNGIDSSLLLSIIIKSADLSKCDKFLLCMLTSCSSRRDTPFHDGYESHIQIFKNYM